jgi:adenosine deaminase
MRRVFLGLLASLALAGTAAAAPDVAAMTRGELAAFTRAMPKGGELHTHLGGNVFAETLLAWAVEDGGCVDVVQLALRPPCTPSETLKPASAVLADETLRSALLDSLSVRHPGFRDRSGHDQFFTAFARLGMPPDRAGDALAYAMEGLAQQNTFYLEIMITPQAAATGAIAAKVPWSPDMAAMKAALSGQGLATLVPAASAALDAIEARARAVLKCGTREPRPGCRTTVRYLVQTNRVVPPAVTFAQIQLGVALVAADRRWVGLQMVAPEDTVPATANYRLHMRMVDFLTDHGRNTPVALHAGEISLKLVPPEEMSYRVGEAVRVAGARRIGHGVSLPHEDRAEALAAEMAAKGVLVEVNLSSNAAILEVEGRDHPYAWLRQRGVPVSLSTDDAGILRIDLSHEYARAATDGASYEDLKRSARNGIAFSFLAGEGLWEDPGTYARPAAGCRGQIGQAEPRPGACANLVRASDKAREQWRHEALLAVFEVTPTR